jgi:multiple sugar transport system ATP-binding protein
MAGIVLEGLSRIYPDGGSSSSGTVAVDRLDLEVWDGEFLVLLGPSGSGKTTTLRMIAGLENVSAGEIRIGGRLVNRLAPRDRDIAMVFQNPSLVPHWTMFQNIACGLRWRSEGGWRSRRSWLPWGDNLSRVAIREQVVETARALGIESLLDRRPGQLSGGERQRVALGRALVRQPAVCLFDEPFSGLDARLRWELRGQLKQWYDMRRGLRTTAQKENKQTASTTIYVTHDQAEALALGDRIAVMDRGKLQQVGSRDEICKLPANRFVAGFIGNPPMNFLAGELRPVESTGVPTGQLEGVQFEGGGWSLPLVGCDANTGGQDAALQVDKQVGQALQRYVRKPLILGVRPHDLRCTKVGGEDDRVDSAHCRTAYLAPAQVVSVAGDWNEPAGSSTVKYVSVVPRSGSSVKVQPLVCSSDAEDRLLPGDSVNLSVDWGRAHWFDPQTERCLGHGLGIG